jgi:hypothetical protein
MAHPTHVNGQISDSISQVDIRVLGDASAMASGNVFIATSQALSNTAHNATTGQQQTNLTSQAATTTGVNTLLSFNTATTASGTHRILRSNVR